MTVDDQMDAATVAAEYERRERAQAEREARVRTLTGK